MKLSLLKLITPFLALIIAINSTRGNSLCYMTKSDIEDINNMTLYVLLYNNDSSDYDKEMIRAVTENWTLTKYEFISVDKIFDLADDPNALYLSPFRGFPEAIGYIPYLRIAKGPCKVNHFDQKKGRQADVSLGRSWGKTLGMVRLDKYLHSNLRLKRAGLWVRMLQNMFIRTRNGENLKRSKNIPKNMGIDWKSDTIFVCETVFEGFINQQDVAKMYPYPFKLITEQEAIDIIDSKHGKYLMRPFFEYAYKYIMIEIVKVSDGTILEQAVDRRKAMYYLPESTAHREAMVNLFFEMTKQIALEY